MPRHVLNSSLPDNTLYCLVKSKPVKQEVSRKGILPPMVSVLWSLYYMFQDLMPWKPYCFLHNLIEISCLNILVRCIFPTKTAESFCLYIQRTCSWQKMKLAAPRVPKRSSTMIVLYVKGIQISKWRNFWYNGTLKTV